MVRTNSTYYYAPSLCVEVAIYLKLYGMFLATFWRIYVAFCCTLILTVKKQKRVEQDEHTVKLNSLLLGN